MFVCLFDAVQRHFHQYFSYIVAVSFIGGGNRRTRRKPPTCLKSLTNFITQDCTPRPDRDSNSLTTSVVIGTGCIGSCKSNYHTITTRTALSYIEGRVVYFIFTFNENPSELVLDDVVLGRY